VAPPKTPKAQAPPSETTEEAPDKKVAAYEKFMASCTKDDSPKAFCNCIWDVIVERLPAHKLPTAEKTIMADEPLKKLASSRCANHLPAEQIRSNYMAGCSSRAPAAICGCMWKKLTTELSPGQVATADVEDAKFAARAKRIAEQCTAEHPELVAEAATRRGFLKGCTKGQRDKIEVCSCAWNKLRKHYTIKQLIAAETKPPPDLKKKLKSIGAACAQATQP